MACPYSDVAIANRADPVASVNPAAEKIAGRLSRSFRLAHRTHPHASITGTPTMALIHTKNRIVGTALSLMNTRIIDENPSC
jgi:hypothetical protein